MALAPWQRRRLLAAQHKKAVQHANNVTHQTINTTDAQYQVALESDLSRLSSINSIERRNQIKASELLARYKDYLDEVLESGQGGQNDVVVQNMIWCLDCGPDHFNRAYELAQFAMKHGMATPERFKRDVLNVLAGQIAEWCIEQLKLVKSPEPHATRIYEFIVGRDVVDQIAAQLHRCQAEKLKADDLGAALEHAETAYELDSKVGVMPLIRTLKKSIDRVNAEEAEGTPTV